MVFSGLLPKDLVRHLENPDELQREIEVLRDRLSRLRAAVVPRRTKKKFQNAVKGVVRGRVLAVFR